jgi:hypothetical protein
MTKVQVIYGFWIMLILLIVSILVVSGVMWEDYKVHATYYLVVAGLATLYLASLAMASATSVKSFLDGMANAAADTLGATN